MSAALQVNEARIWATRQGDDWWNSWRARMERTGRITILTPSLGGDLVSVACDSRDDAVWLRDHMVSFAGIPKGALKVTASKEATRDHA